MPITQPSTAHRPAAHIWDYQPLHHQAALEPLTPQPLEQLHLEVYVLRSLIVQDMVTLSAVVNTILVLTNQATASVTLTPPQPLQPAPFTHALEIHICPH